MAKVFGLLFLLCGLDAQSIIVNRDTKDIIPINKTMELGAGVLWSNGAADFKQHHLNRAKLKSTSTCFWKTDTDSKNTSVCIKITQSGYRLGPETKHTTDLKGCATGTKCTFTIPKTMEAKPKFDFSGQVANGEWKDYFTGLLPAQARRELLKMSMKFKFNIDDTIPKEFWFRPIMFEAKASIDTTVDNKPMKASVDAMLPLKLESGAIDAIYGNL
ncbi:hypothetical protein DSO57_1016561 [Entomophthora muscae]|uniref:Uncharacterized protein n=1 Tax=Entomophthora muscae TaxID=34485 RepID=A0ACC2S6T0_9FUNG|nr:hypothetical protein DSO57_1016561 [Entomophthora muscae]